MNTFRNHTLPRLHKAGAQARHLPGALALVWRAARGHLAAWALLLALQGLLPAAVVTLTRALVDRLARAIGQPAGAAWQGVLTLALGLAAVLVAQELLRGAATWVRTLQAERVQDYIADLVHRQSAAVDMAFYDSPDYYDQLHRARGEATHRPTALLENLGALLQNGLTLGALAAILWRYGPWVPAVLLVSTLPALWAVLRQYAHEHRWREATTPLERKAWYYSWLLSTRENAAEVRLFGLAERFRAAYSALRARLRDEHARLLRGQTFTRAATGLLALAVVAGAMAWMLRRAAQGQATLGDLVLFYQAFAQGQGLMRALLENLGQIYGSSLFLGNLFAFLSLQPTVLDPPGATPQAMTLTQGIRLEGVTFAYPDSSHRALTGLDLDLPAGQVVALVGPNGAGKSTLIKLLCRFYDPQAGRITWDGVDLRDLRRDDLRRAITVLFQEPVRYHTTAAENIALGDETLGETSPEIAQAAAAAGADAIITRLPQGYATLLGKWFHGGTDLSVGEWQRLALARAFMRRAALIILDEPTSAMDSWAEADWMARFRQLTAGRTALIVTHRFTTAMRADVIYVLEGQRIVESGSHAQLLALGGRYAASWQAQMRD
ncbi:MAG: ABC transporter ATP-binding protein [Chloroflexota bacterium]